MQPNDAETRALQVLAWLIGEEEILAVFLGSTGASASDLRARLSDPEFLASVLDFVLMDDHWVVPAAKAAGLRPEELAQLRARLPGGDLPSWT